MLGGPLVNAASESIGHNWCDPVIPTVPCPIQLFNHRLHACTCLTVGTILDNHAGKNLQAQYERWQPRAKYKMHLDPTMDDVKKLAVSSRRAAKVDTLSLRHCRTPGRCTACMHLHFAQPGHAGFAYLHIHLLIHLHTDTVACRLGHCTHAAPACIWTVVTALLCYCTCFHSSCIGRRPPGSHDDDSVYSTCSTCRT